MTDLEWTIGWGKLQAAGLPGWPTDDDAIEARTLSLRESLDDLSGAAWLYAARGAAKLERWFPPAAVLREYAEDYTPPRLELPPARDDQGNPLVASEADIEARRDEDRRRMQESNRRGLAQCVESLLKHGIDVGRTVRTMPTAGPRLRVVAQPMTDAQRERRVAELHAQARKLEAGDEDKSA